MEMTKAMVAIIMMVQISLGLSMPTSFADENINAEVSQQHLEEPKELQSETAEIQLPFVESDNVLPNEKQLQHSSNEASGVIKTVPLDLTKDFSPDFGKLPVSDPNQILSSLPDLEKMKRDQLLALAMAQLMLYTQSLIHQSESKFSDILKDLDNLKDDATFAFMEMPKHNIQKYLQQLEDYKVEAASFVARTIDIPMEFHNLMSQLKSSTVDSFEMEQILQHHNLGNFEKDIAKYLETFKNLFQHELERLTNDLAAIGEESEDKLMTLLHDLVYANESKDQMESFSQMFKLY